MMKRTPLQRKTPLKAKSGLKTKKPLKAKTSLKSNSTLRAKTPIKSKCDIDRKVIDFSKKTPLKRKTKKPPTKAESQHLNRVASLGCVVCRNLGYGVTPLDMTAIHHIREGQGMAQRASHYEAFGLCGAHHQHGGYGIAIHAGQEEWEKRYGNESSLLFQTYTMLMETYPSEYTVNELPFSIQKLLREDDDGDADSKRFAS